MSVPSSGPPHARESDVIETLHGVAVADPYRWLEDGASDETRAWVTAQNAFTSAILGELPRRAAIHGRLDELLTTGLVGTPVLRGPRAFYARRDGQADQPRLVVRDAADAAERTIVDPNALSAQGIVALDWWYPSDDGRLLAYGLSEGGTELSTLHVLDVTSGGPLATDQIPHTRFASVAWLPDGSGFYYTRYPSPGSVPAGEEMYHRHVFFHPLGQDWQADEEVFGAGRAAEDSPSVAISSSGRWLIVEVRQGWLRTELYLQDRERGERGFVAVQSGVETIATTEFAGDRLFVLTNEAAPNYALYEVDPEQPQRDRWRLVIPERDDRVLNGVWAIAGRLVTHEMEHASSCVRWYDLDGTLQSEARLPAIGSVTGIGGEWTGDHATFGFTSFVEPSTAYTLDLETGAAHVFAQGALPPGFDAAGYVVSQEWYTSRDGTRISIFLVHRRGLKRAGNVPTLLTGYGGFNVSRTPAFNSALPLWLDAGGLYALPNLRGGGEYGEKWHRAGMLEHKQNVFDDFIAAAEWLIARGFTRPSRLAISGGSNGGLLVGAALTQRPDLFQAVVCQVPLLDMLRFQNLLIARLWVSEYGSSADAQHFQWLYAYSPYHRVQRHERYPATFLLTAEGDSRVDPMHARKMAARLQATTASEAPILLRVETAAGHGQGKPRSKQLDESTDVWSFLFWQLGVKV
jgi:prolyl oligopeptidase